MIAQICVQISEVNGIVYPVHEERGLVQKNSLANITSWEHCKVGDICLQGRLKLNLSQPGHPMQASVP